MMDKIKILVLGIVVAVLASVSLSSVAFAEQNLGGASGVDGVYSDGIRNSGGPGYSEFYAYLKRGEKLSADFTLLRTYETTPTGKTSFIVHSPSGEASLPNVEVAGSEPVGTTKSFSTQEAVADGVWKIVVKNDGIRRVYSWNIGVYSGGNLVPGRVWVDRYLHEHLSDASQDLTLWYINDSGYKYKANYYRYNGYTSVFQSNSVGVSTSGTCTPAYQSVADNIWNLANFNPGNDVTGRFNDSCNNSVYRIFFAEPAADLPESARAWDGSTMEIAPSIKSTQIDSLSFTYDGVSPMLAGKVKYNISNYLSTVRVLIDVNNNGSFSDSVDRELTQGTDAEGAQEVNFDGKDGEGRDISIDSTIRIQIVADKKGEIHFVNSDVERRARGIEIQRLNGSVDKRDLIFFDDSRLSAQNRCGTWNATLSSGKNGLSSTGGIHSWDWGNCGQSMMTWGDNRTIDDWTYDVSIVDKSIIYTYIPPSKPSDIVPSAPNTGNLRIGVATSWLAIFSAASVGWMILRQRK